MNISDLSGHGTVALHVYDKLDWCRGIPFHELVNYCLHFIIFIKFSLQGLYTTMRGMPSIFMLQVVMLVVCGTGNLSF